jgi:hypothetical protein
MDLRRHILVLLLFLGTSCLADTITVDRIQSEGSETHNFVLKKIVEKMGNRLRALIIDRDGREQSIYITSEDAIEIKRGLWVIRPGTYQTEI